MPDSRLDFAMISSRYPLLLACFLTLSAAAQDAHERSDLSLIQRQITVIEQLADRARISQVDVETSRYNFDYPRFVADLERMRYGISKYLSPSRAQPTDLAELTSDYRADAPHPSSPDEHD
jgi:RAQPRD family integrative conjugative element protein